jgi:predicted dehydrogenase
MTSQRQQQRPLRVGLIGVGFGTTVHIPGFQSEGLDVVAVCARREERAKEAAAKFGVPQVFTDYRKMLASPDIDIVSVASPHPLHAEMSIAALEAGKHVLCEKPTAVNADEARRMRDAARKRSNQTAMIGHEFRWAPQRAYVKELLDQGYIGKLHFVQGCLFMGPRRPVRPRPAAERDLGLRGGFLWGLGSHYLDAYRHWFGDIVSVQALMRAQHAERLDPSGKTVTTETDDTFSLIVEFANGGWGTLTGTSAAPFGQGASIEIFGSEGSLATPQPIPLAFNPPPEGKVYGARFGDDEGPDRKELPMPERHRPFDDDRDHRLMAFRLMVRAFVQGVRDGGRSPAPNFDDAYRVQQVLDAAVESAKTGRKIAIPLD